MNREQKNRAVTKYVIINNIILIFLAIVLVIIVEDRANSLCYSRMASLLFKEFSIMMSIILPIISLDALIYESSIKDSVDNKILLDIHSNKKTAYIEIFFGASSLFFLMILGNINQWINEVYKGKYLDFAKEIENYSGKLFLAFLITKFIMVIDRVMRRKK